jgi:hypothetical protein
MIASGCATTSLHSPKPVGANYTSLGLHVGFISGAKLAEEGRDPLFLAGTGRAGITERVEVGLNVGTNGIDGALKFGLTPGDCVLQVSVLGGGGLYNFRVPQFNLGLLAGANLEGLVLPYIGTRGHMYLSPLGKDEPVFYMINLIIGLHLFPARQIGFLAEFDYNESLSDAVSTNMKFDHPILSGGLVIRY